MKIKEPETTLDLPAQHLRESIRLLVRRFSLAERADMSCCGMTVAQAATLDALGEGDLRLSDLGARLGIAPSTLTRNLVRLEERGLVSRQPDPDDGRAQLVVLTESGIEACRTVRHQEEQFARSVLDLLPPGTEEDTMASFKRLLQAVRAATETCCPGAYDHLMKN